MIIDLKLQIILFIASLIFFYIVTISSIKRKMAFKYSVLWLILSFVFITIAVYPNLVGELSKFIGVYEPIHLIFLVVLAFVLLVIFIYNYTISELVNDKRLLIQEIAILKKRVNDLENNKKRN